MAGDDTFVDIPQMIRFLDGYDSNEKHFIAECCTNGQSSTCEYNTPFDASSDIQFYSSCGGGGWIFSQGLIDAMISFSNNANKSPGTLIHETRAPFNTYQHVIEGRITQESDLGYAIKKLFGTDLTPKSYLNSGAPHEYVERNKWKEACKRR